MKSITALAGKLSGLDIWVIGSGSSLLGFDYSQLLGKPTIALNKAGARFQPWIHLFADEVLWKEYSVIKHLPDTAVVCQDGAMAQLNAAPSCCFRKQIFLFKRAGMAKVRKGDEQLFVKKTVATAGIELAWKLGASHIFLLGVDAYRTAKHYYCDTSRPRREEKGHAIGDNRLQEDRHKDWCLELSEVQRFLLNDYLPMSIWPSQGIYNVGKHSAVECWPKINLEEALSASTTLERNQELLWWLDNRFQENKVARQVIAVT